MFYIQFSFKMVVVYYEMVNDLTTLELFDCNTQIISCTVTRETVCPFKHFTQSMQFPKSFFRGI